MRAYSPHCADNSPSAVITLIAVLSLSLRPRDRTVTGHAAVVSLAGTISAGSDSLDRVVGHVILVSGRLVVTDLHPTASVLRVSPRKRASRQQQLSQRSRLPVPYKDPFRQSVRTRTRDPEQTAVEGGRMGCGAWRRFIVFSKQDV